MYFSTNESFEINPYNFQINRIIRGLSKIPRDPFVTSVSDNMMDDYYHLFVDLFHLKDWLKNDSTFSASKEVINSYVENDEYLKKLQSLVNGIKHLKVTNPDNHYPKAQPIFAKWGNEKEHGEAVVVIFTIDAKGRAGDDSMLGSAFVVACISSWNKFFLEKVKSEPFSLNQMRK